MSNWLYVVLLTITGHITDDLLITVLSVLSLSSSGLEMRRSLLPIQRVLYIKSKLIFSLFHLEWVILGRGSRSYKPWHYSKPNVGRQRLKLSQGPAQEMRSQWHFCLISEGAWPCSSSFSEHEHCAEWYICCYCELRLCSLLMQWKNTDFSHSFLCKANS